MLVSSQTFEKYVKANIRKDFASKDYNLIDFDHFYQFCGEMAKRPYILDFKNSPTVK